MLRSLRRVGRRDLLDGAIVFGASMIINVCNYAFHALSSRHLGVNGYGELASLVAVLTLLSFPTSAISLGIAKLSAELHATDDRAGIRKVVDVIGRWAAIAGIVTVALAGATLAWSSGFLHIPDLRVLMLAAVALAVSFAVPPLRAVLQGVDDFSAYGSSLVVEGVAKLSLGIGFVYAGFGVLGALAGFVCGSLCALGYVLFSLRKHIAGWESLLVVDARRLFETAGSVGATSLAFVVLGTADVVAVKHFLNPYDAGLYGALSLVGKIFLFAVAFLPQLVLPKVARRSAAGSSSGHYLWLSVAVVAVVGLSGVAASSLAPGLVLRIVAGRAFVSIAGLLVPYALAMTFLAIANVAATYRIGAHRLGFGFPMLLVTVGELCAFLVWHDSAWQIVRTVLIGHLTCAAVTLYGATERPVAVIDVSVDVAA